MFYYYLLLLFLCVLLYQLRRVSISCPCTTSSSKPTQNKMSKKSMIMWILMTTLCVLLDNVEVVRRLSSAGCHLTPHHVLRTSWVPAHRLNTCRLYLDCL